MDWREELAEILILAGTTGLKQYAIIKRFDNWVGADDLVMELEGLQAMNKVQKFVVRAKRGRPATVWRATNLILKPDHEVCETHSGGK